VFKKETGGLMEMVKTPSNSNDEVRTVQVHTYPPMEDVVQEMRACQEVLVNMLSKRFPSEHNLETLQYAQNALDGYCYVRPPYRLWPGRYVRYLDMTDAYAMKLKLGGFCVSDNGYTVRIRRTFDNRTISVSRQNRLFFMVINDTDVTRIQMNALLN
jgi:hypothetical protein